MMYMELNAVQIWMSPQAKAYFAKVCEEEGIQPLELIKWVHTRWGSMYDLINHVIINKAVCYFLVFYT